jgi:hypothetical protein
LRLPRPTTIQHEGRTYLAFTPAQLKQIAVVFQTHAGCAAQIKAMRTQIEDYDLVLKRQDQIMDIAGKRYKLYKDSYKLLEEEWKAVNREKNKWKYRRRWAKLWQPLGLGTLLTIAGAVAYSNR